MISCIEIATLYVFLYCQVICKSVQDGRRLYFQKNVLFNLLDPELFLLILAHPVHKM